MFMHPLRLVPLALTLALIAFPAPARAQTSYPMLSRIEPTAVQRGQSIVIAIAGSGTGGAGGDFSNARELLCEGPGLKGEILAIEKPEPAAASGSGASKKGRRRANANVKARLTVAPDAPLGPREVRVATSQGASSVGLIVVVNDPVVPEADDKANDVPEQAQALTLPAVAAGSIGKPEDVDWYSFRAEAGQTVTFSVWANRLENKIHDLQMHFDPILQLHDAQGRARAADDNHDFADPRLTYRFPEAGTYRLQVRDTTYGGNANWTYALQATAGPVASAVSPMAVGPGARASLHALGVNFDPLPTISLDVPDDQPLGLGLFALPTAQGPTLPVPLVVTRLPVVEEKADAPDTAALGQDLALPAALGGKLGAPNDVDVYRFPARKGRTYAFEVVSRRAGAATDPVLRIVNARDAVQAEADDTFGKDPRLEWTAPADGPFAVQVSDLHSRGGDDFGYVLLAEPASPDFVLTCDPDKLNLGPGARVPVFVQVTRRAGFSGPVTMEWEGLPPGLSASPLTVLPALTQGVIVVSAAPDTKPAAAFVSLSGKAETPDGPIARKATPKQEIYMPGGGRGFHAVNTLALTGTDPSDITVEAKPAEIALAPGGTATIDVTIQRRDGFEQAVNLAVVLQHLGAVHGNPLPPGVTVREAGSKTLLGPKETAGKIVLQAATAAAACDKVPIAVMGHVSINFVVKTSYSSLPITISVVAKEKTPAP